MTAFVNWDPEDVGIEADLDGDLWDVNYVRSDWYPTEAEARDEVVAVTVNMTNDPEWNAEWRIDPTHPDQPVETRKRKDGLWQAAIRVVKPYVHEEEPT